MIKLNNINWQYFVYHFPIPFQKIHYNPLPDFECIQIGSSIDKINNVLEAPKSQDFEAIGAKANFYSMITKSKKNELKLLK